MSGSPYMCRRIHGLPPWGLPGPHHGWSWHRPPCRPECKPWIAAGLLHGRPAAVQVHLAGFPVILTSRFCPDSRARALSVGRFSLATFIKRCGRFSFPNNWDAAACAAPTAFESKASPQCRSTSRSGSCLLVGDFEVTHQSLPRRVGVGSCFSWDNLRFHLPN